MSRGDEEVLCASTETKMRWSWVILAFPEIDQGEKSGVVLGGVLTEEGTKALDLLACIP